MTIRRAAQGALTALLTPDGRRAWALVLLAGGGAMMTLYAALALYFVQNRAAYVFYLGLAAHFTIFIVITGFAGLLVKRNIIAQLGENRRLEFSDQAEAVALAADKVAGAATEAAEEVKDATA